MPNDTWKEIEDQVNQEAEFQFYLDEEDGDAGRQKAPIKCAGPAKKPEPKTPAQIAQGCLVVVLAWAALIFIVWAVNTAQGGI